MLTVARLPWVVLPVVVMSVGPTPGWAAPRAVPVFTPGHAPQRPMEILTEMTMEVGNEVSKAMALDQMRRRAQELGADAVLDVVVKEVRRDLPVSQMAAMPVVLLGSLVSLMAWTPDPLAGALAAARSTPLHRKVKVVTGVAVRYVR